MRKKRFLCTLVTCALGLTILSGCDMIGSETVTKQYQKTMASSTQYADGRIVEKEYRYEDARRGWQATSCVFYENGAAGKEEYYQWNDQELLAAISYSDGSPEQRFEYQYNDAQNVEQCTVWIGDAEDHTRHFVYDDAGKLVEETRLRDGVVELRIETAYGKDGWRESETHLDQDGKEFLRRVFKYDEKTGQETVKEYDGSDVLQGYWINTYNSAGVRGTEEYYDADGNLVFQTQHTIVPFTRRTTVFSEEET